MTYPVYIDEIIRRLEDAGESAYIVGGSLRDMLIGQPPHDYDIATSALPERTMELFADKRVIATGLKHGTVTVIAGGEPVEITTFRIDGEYTDSRHPDSVTFTDKITEDLSRRDFTVNAMAYSKERGLVDPFGGREDLQRKVIRAVRDPHLRFSEDALRIMRAFRFSAQLGFDIERATLEGALATKAGLADIARERITSELLRLIISPSPCEPLRLMVSGGIFEYVLGGYAPSDLLIQKITQLEPCETERLALLLADCDRERARKLLGGLRLSGKQTTAVLATLTGADFKVATAEDARRLIANTGIYASAAARLSQALGVSDMGAAELVGRQQNTPCTLHDLKVNGKDMADLGIKGKRIGQTLSALLERVIEEPELNEREALLEMAKALN